MRQLFTWRFVAAVAALAGLALILNAVVVDDDELTAVSVDESIVRRVDLISSVFFAEGSDDFEIGPDGLTVGFVDFTLENRRIMRVAPGTPGDIQCDLKALNRCVVFADLLGEAVVWFGVRPKVDREQVELSAILDLQDGYALFDNGWQIPYAPVIDRSCRNEDIVSFSDFLRRFGPRSITTVDVATKQVTAVRCAGTEAPVVSTTTTEPLPEIPVDSPTDVIGTVLDDPQTELVPIEDLVDPTTTVGSNDG